MSVRKTSSSSRATGAAETPPRKQAFGIPFALVPLLMLTRNPEVMGGLANPRWLTVLASSLAALIIALNVFLLFQVFFG